MPSERGLWVADANLVTRRLRPPCLRAGRLRRGLQRWTPPSQPWLRTGAASRRFGSTLLGQSPGDVKSAVWRRLRHHWLAVDIQGDVLEPNLQGALDKAGTAFRWAGQWHLGLERSGEHRARGNVEGVPLRVLESAHR
jgi:hypothetical protein